MTGFDVEAIDGSIGKIDESSFEADNSHIVVDTGFWIFGKKRLIPAGAVTGSRPREREGDGRPHARTRSRARPTSNVNAGTTRPTTIHRSNYNEYYGPHGW